MLRKTVAPVLAVTMLFAAGCNEETECESACLPGAGAVYCTVGLQSMVVCGPDTATAAASCAALGGNAVPAVVCEGEPYTETGGEGPPDDPWEPGRDITRDPDTGEYIIDEVFFEDLKADPAPLYDDSTVLRETVDGHHQVVHVGELADALGWEADDLLLSVNGTEILGLSGFMEAYSQFSNTDQFALTVGRRRSAVVLRYRVE